MSAPKVTFNDPVPGHPLVSGSEEPEVPPATPTTGTPEPPAEPVVTNQDRDDAGNLLWRGTVARMNTLVEALVIGTDNADLALWAPAAVLETMLQRLDFSAPNRWKTVRLLTLVVEFLNEYSNWIQDYLKRYMDAIEAKLPPPEYPEWKKEHTLALYDKVREVFPDSPPPAKEQP